MIDNILSRLNKVKRVGDGKWKACCPAHDDKSPSLAIAQKGDKVLLHCFSGCGIAEILSAIELDWSDIFEHAEQIGKLTNKEFHALHVLGIVRGEIAQAWLLAVKMEHGPLTQDERERLALCVSRLDSADEFARGSRWTQSGRTAAQGMRRDRR